jgi:hypothetical protein
MTKKALIEEITQALGKATTEQLEDVLNVLVRDADLYPGTGVETEDDD